MAACIACACVFELAVAKAPSMLCRSVLAGLVTVPTLFAASRAFARDADKALAA